MGFVVPFVIRYLSVGVGDWSVEFAFIICKDSSSVIDFIFDLISYLCFYDKQGQIEHFS